jgi:hypothetical protein
MSQIHQIRAALTTAPHGLYLREVVDATGIRRENVNTALRSLEKTGEVVVVLIGLKKYIPTKLLSTAPPVKRGRPPMAAKTVKPEVPAHRTGPIVARPLSLMEMLA